MARLSDMSAKGLFKQPVDSGEGMDQGGPSQTRWSTQLSCLLHSMNLTCNIHKPWSIAASHRRWCYPRLKLFRDRFITRKSWLGRLWTLNSPASAFWAPALQCALPHSSEVFSRGLCSPLPQGSLPPLYRWWWRDTWFVPIFVAHMYSGMDLYPLGCAGTCVVWIVYIHNSDREGQILKMQREAVLAILCGMPDLRTSEPCAPRAGRTWACPQVI